MREIGPMHEAQEKIETEARRMGKWPDQPPTEHQIELSKAISLKRIADELTGSFHGANGGLIHHLREIDRTLESSR